MEDHTFWKLIEKAKKENRFSPDRYAKQLADLLMRSTDEEVFEFNTLVQNYLNQLYRWDLWDAAYIIGGGCSKNEFYSFRLWLIAQGEPTYCAALATPDSLADYVRKNEVCAFDELAFLAAKVWSTRTGKPETEFPVTEPDPTEPAGVPLEEDDPNLFLLYPKLSRKFGC